MAFFVLVFSSFFRSFRSFVRVLEYEVIVCIVCMIKTCFDEFVKCFAHRLDDMMNKRLASIAFQRKERGGAGNCFYDCAGAEVGVSGSVLREKTAEYLKCNPDENEKISLFVCVFLSLVL